MPINLKPLLPKQVVDRFDGKENILKILANTFWLVSDRVFRMAAALFIGAWVARYLSPDHYGKLNNAIAFASMFGAFAMLGFESILIRELVKDQDRKNSLMGTAFYMRLSASFVTYLLAVVSVMLIKNRPGDEETRTMTYIISAGIFFQSFDVIDLFFQSQVKAKYTVLAKNMAFTLVTLAKLGLLVVKAPLVMFAWAWLAEMVFNAVGLVWVYRRQKQQLSGWRFSRQVAIELLRESWPMYLAFICSYVFMRIDQIMISKLMNDYNAGLFAASNKLFEIPLFVMLVIASSVFPSLVNVYNTDKELFYKRYEQITTFTTAAGYAIIAGVWILGKPLIGLFFGDAYSAAYPILRIQIVGMFFLFNACLRSSYLTITSNQKIILATSIASTFINVPLNYFLIKSIGVTGAAYALAITYLFSLLLFNLFFAKTRRIFSIQLKSIILLPSLIAIIKKRLA